MLPDPPDLSIFSSPTACPARPPGWNSHPRSGGRTSVRPGPLGHPRFSRRFPQLEALFPGTQPPWLKVIPTATTPPGRAH
ncbi:MAG: hypothetical protein JSR82_08895 [Verrucomicrobia bacterium]|nr:hypothetical protein [Verrucomicrobiota bacterium]